VTHRVRVWESDVQGGGGVANRKKDGVSQSEFLGERGKARTLYGLEVCRRGEGENR